MRGLHGVTARGQAFGDGKEAVVMAFMDFWKYLTRRRRISFYDSQHAMRAAIASLGPIDLTRLSDDELRRIVAEEPNSMRGDAARRQLAWRTHGQSGPDMRAAN